MSHIHLDPEHGVNPTIPRCFFCGEQKNEIILMGNKGARFAREAGINSRDGTIRPGTVCFDRQPCDSCIDIMKAGIIFISVKDGEENKPDNDNPYRTGGWCALTEDAVRRMSITPSSLLEDICTKRVCFLPDTVYDFFGLPRKEVPGVPSSPTEFKEQQDGQASQADPDGPHC